METIREYLLSVTMAAIVCAVVRRLLDKKGTPAAVGKLLTGLFMTLTVLSPLTDISFGPLKDLTLPYEQQAQQAVKDGEKYATEEIRKGIIAETEAYILDKAEAMGARIHVTVYVSDGAWPVPEQVRISGDISPLARNKLKGILEDELGVPEENQLWT